MQYYVAAVDRRTHQHIPFSEVDCSSALDAQETLEAFAIIDPSVDYLVGARQSAEELTAFAHSCRACNCQFDRNRQLIATGDCHTYATIGDPLPPRPDLPAPAILAAAAPLGPSAEETVAYQTLARDDNDMAGLVRGLRHHDSVQLPLVPAAPLQAVLAVTLAEENLQ